MLLRFAVCVCFHERVAAADFVHCQYQAGIEKKSYF